MITLPQLDFAATLARLLGVPIPYGNIGQVNPEMLRLGMLWQFETQEDKRGAEAYDQAWLAAYVDALLTNAQQVGTTCSALYKQVLS